MGASIRARLQSKKKSNTAPVARGFQRRTTPPRVSNSPGAVLVSHREYLGDIIGSVEFAIAKDISVNPGLIVSFPWLHSIAQMYETYFVRSMRFEYETQQSTALGGTVILAMDYDPSDVPPTGKTQMLSYAGAVRSAPWMSCVFPITMKDASAHGSGRFVRASTISGTDIKLYDIGRFFVATQGFAGATPAGELYVNYTIEFRTPQQAVIVPPPTPADLPYYDMSDNATIDTMLSGDGGEIVGGGNIDLMAVGNTITFNQIGEFLFLLHANGVAIQNQNPDYNNGTATVGQLVTDWYPNSAFTAADIAFPIQVTAVGQTLVIDFTSTASSFSHTKWRLTPYNALHTA